jgi:DNA processing protein
MNTKSIIMALTEAGGVGPRTFQQLLMRFGPPDNLLHIQKEELEEIPRLGENGSERIINSLDLIDEYEKKLLDYAFDGIVVNTYLDDDYPEALREIDDPPPVIYTKGNRDILKQNFVAMVGTTQATTAGIRLAVDLAREYVKRGFGIVSGLAIGIDSAAHLGAIKEQGATIAVLGCGILNIYPPDNITLAENIARTGLLISEYPPTRRVKAGQLILRNRLISAFSKAVIVVQIGSTRRGELRTANYALKQAKPLFFADPEGILDPETIKSSHALIIKGTESVDEVVKYMV